MLNLSKMFEIESLSVEKNGVEKLKDISFMLDEGEILSILGINGAGKSTLALALAGHIPYKATKAFFDGNDIQNHSVNDLMKLGLAFIPESKIFFEGITVEEHLDISFLALDLFPKKNTMDKRKNFVYEMFPRLFERKKQLANLLSGGEKQMLLIATALVLEPKLLILDEPSQGLSLKMVDQIFDMLVALSKEKIGIILIEQNIYQSLDISDKAVVIENGNITLSGSAKDIKNNSQLENYCLGLV